MNEPNLDFILELYNSPKLFKKLLEHLSPDEQKRYMGQVNWFIKKCNEFIANSGYSFVVPEGIYDVGIAATPLNLSDFDKEEELLIAQVVEPIVMYRGKVVKSGAILLKPTKGQNPVVEIIEPQIETTTDIQKDSMADSEKDETHIKFVEIDFSNTEAVTLGDVLTEKNNNKNNEQKGDE